MMGPAATYNSVAAGLGPIAKAAFLRWWCEELVRALLRGAWRFVGARDGAAQDAAFARFEGLVDAAPCWPCYVEYWHPRAMAERATRGLRCQPCLLILTGEAAEYGWEEEEFA